MTGAVRGYRPDIDGLRTLAIVPVVLFHAGLRGFSGGYVGVDVFFVISGYLITGILLGEFSRGSFSIGRFYDRRIRRIFPALATVLLATLIVGWFVLAPSEYDDLGRSVAAVTVFASNFYFWRSVNYFDNAQAIEPLLHTWSLAVEEQFYIVFPPLLAWLVRRRYPLLPILGALTAVSFGLAAVCVFRKPSATFYLPITRTWELLIGAMLAAAPILPSAGRRLREAAAVLGVVLIVLSIVLYDSATVFPGAAALPPSLGAALVIWGGMNGLVTPVGRLLSLTPMTSVGRISYSLYLWHVPVFAFAAFLAGGALASPTRLVSIALSLALAWASYRWVETPFRAAWPGTRWRAAGIGVAAMTAVLVLAAGVALTHGAPFRLSSRSAALIDVANDKQRFHVECLSVGDRIVEPGHACRLGTTDAIPSVLLWGDSHAMVTATAMEVAARRRHASFLFTATADCPIGSGFSIDDGFVSALTGTPSYRFCARYNAEMLRVAMTTPSIRTVVLSSRWTNWRIGEPANPAESTVDIRLRDTHGVARSGEDNAAIFAGGFLRLVSALQAAGKQVVVVGPLPEPRFNVPHRLFVGQFGLAAPVGPITIADYQTRHRRIIAFFQHLRAMDHVAFIWPSSVLCRRDVCPIEESGSPVFFDHNHLSIRAARRTASLYDMLFVDRGARPRGALMTGGAG